MVIPRVVDGDLLAQDTEVIVNAWNRNIIPWWLLVPQGVSGAIKRRAGYQPFRELGRLGPIPLGGAVLTSAGRLPYKGIIHVAGINMFWLSSKQSIQESVYSAMSLANREQFKSVAFPLIGAGTGGLGEESALELMLDAFKSVVSPAAVTVVRFRRQTVG
jgi:O-acetyl-ADP-ribose deacetylase